MKEREMKERREKASEGKGKEHVKGERDWIFLKSADMTWNKWFCNTDL